MAYKMKYEGSQLNAKLSKMGPKVGTALLMYMSTKTKSIESSMKVNRPWTDRTGMAKATLSGTLSQPSPDLMRITLAHGVEYGIWLELAHEKNYAIIAPTISKEGPRLMEGLNKFMVKLKL